MIAGIAVIGIGLYTVVTLNSGYRVKLVIPSAAQLVEGSPVLVNGLPAGSVEDISIRDGKAVVDASIDKEFAPLREGTTSWVEWYSAVGERVMYLTPGPVQNAAIASGDLYAPSVTKQAEVDQVLAALDPPTRAKLDSLLTDLDGTVTGREDQLRATLNTAGPAINALGGVLQGLGRDGQSIKDLVSQMNEVTNIATEHQNDIAASVQNLTALSGPVAEQQAKISEALKELPPTLSVAQDTLADVPKAVDATDPLLNDLEPAAKRLPSFSRNLNGVLDNLRPAMADLRPTLDSLNDLLGKTPDLLDRTHDVLPPIGHIAARYSPAAAFLRPYTPELVGWLQNFGQGFSGYDAQGHFWAATLGEAGVNSVDEYPVNPPTNNPSRTPLPGAAVGQPWTDASGSKEN
ncbi:MAG TPA: MlaD family protein [Pseudonocardia sp.]|nr:MlaD family protein [Pseudonocardia sp.]